MNEEGVIKFTCNWIQAKPIEDAELLQLNAWRDKLYELELLGVTPEGIGYGNISFRFDGGFAITGSGSGSFSKLTSLNYTKVTSFDIYDNNVTCEGPVVASSESMTHAAIYEKDKSINAVFHVHHHAMWIQLLNSHPATAKDIPYGTPEMALEVMNLVHNNNKGIFAMGGHEDGIIAYGKNVDEAGQLLLDELRKLH